MQTNAPPTSPSSARSVRPSSARARSFAAAPTSTMPSSSLRPQSAMRHHRSNGDQQRDGGDTNGWTQSQQSPPYQQQQQQQLVPDNGNHRRNHSNDDADYESSALASSSRHRSHDTTDRRVNDDEKLWNDTRYVSNLPIRPLTLITSPHSLLSSIFNNGINRGTGVAIASRQALIQMHAHRRAQAATRDIGSHAHGSVFMFLILPYRIRATHAALYCTL
jgi:hypothetical protein